MREGAELNLVSTRVAMTQQRRNKTGHSTSTDLSQELPLNPSAARTVKPKESVLYGSVPSMGLTASR